MKDAILLLIENSAWKLDEVCHKIIDWAYTRRTLEKAWKETWK